MDHSEIEKISKSLADQTRLWIFEAISATSHMNCGEIVSMGGVTPATVSHHLKILCEAGLITCRRDGQFVYSEAVPETIAAYARALAKIARGKKAARRSLAEFSRPDLKHRHRRSTEAERSSKKRRSGRPFQQE